VRLAAGGQLQRRITPQGLMVVAVFVARRQAKDSLSQQLPLLVCDRGRVAGIGDRFLDRIQQAQLPVDLPHDEQPRVATESPAAEIGLDATATQA
jgi:hypothetical protein